ncbi:MAG: response regulator transcription factor [Gammaproteobacteria bacterium]
MKENLKILIADDHNLVRVGLKIALDELPARPLPIEAASAAEVREALSAHPDIDLIVLDLQMPDVSDLDLLTELCNTWPDIPVVVVSANENCRVMQRAIEHGAAGFIPKSVANGVLVSAMQLVLSGGVYIPSELFGSGDMDSPPAGREGMTGGMPVRRETFTARQLDVLELMAGGHSNKYIAKQLGLSEHTIKIHISAILRILDVNNRTEAAIACSKLELFSPH